MRSLLAVHRGSFVERRKASRPREGLDALGPLGGATAQRVCWILEHKIARDVEVQQDDYVPRVLNWIQNSYVVVAFLEES